MLGGGAFLWPFCPLHRQRQSAQSIRSDISRTGAARCASLTLNFRTSVWPGVGPRQEGPIRYPGAELACTTTTTYSATCSVDRVWLALADGQRQRAGQRSLRQSRQLVIFPGNVPQNAPGLCGQPIGSVDRPRVRDLQNAFQAANAALTAGSPESQLALGQALNSQQGLLGPDYQTPRRAANEPRSPETVQAGDLVECGLRAERAGTHYLLGYDTNHVGDATHTSTPLRRCTRLTIR